MQLRAATFDEWLSILRPLCDAVTELLWLTRQNARPRREVAIAGVFLLNLERDAPASCCELRCPLIPQFFPEISGSHHRCTIRFLVGGNVASTRPDSVLRERAFPADNLHLSAGVDRAQCGDKPDRFVPHL